MPTLADIPFELDSAALMEKAHLAEPALQAAQSHEAPLFGLLKPALPAAMHRRAAALLRAAENHCFPEAVFRLLAAEEAVALGRAPEQGTVAG